LLGGDSIDCWLVSRFFPHPSLRHFCSCTLANDSNIVLDSGVASSWTVQATEPPGGLRVLPFFGDPHKLINLHVISQENVARAFARCHITCLACLVLSESTSESAAAGRLAFAGDPARVLVACNGGQLRGHFILAGNWGLSLICARIRPRPLVFEQAAVRCALASLQGAAASPIAEYDLMVRLATRPLWLRVPGQSEAIRSQARGTGLGLLQRLCAGAAPSTVVHEALQRRAPVPARASAGAAPAGGQSAAPVHGRSSSVAVLLLRGESCTCCHCGCGVTVIGGMTTVPALGVWLHVFAISTSKFGLQPPSPEALQIIRATTQVECPRSRHRIGNRMIIPSRCQ